MQKNRLIAAILLMGVLLSWLLLWEPAPDPDVCDQTPALGEAPAGGGFTLNSYRGRVSLADFHGKVVLLYFGYTWCPDICPTSLGLTSLALEALEPNELERVQCLFVSVDPQRDTVERLKDYVEYFHPKILGLTGSPGEVAEVARLYGAAYHRVQQASEPDYVVDHSADTYLIDPQGRLVETLPHGAPAERILTLIRKYLD